MINEAKWIRAKEISKLAQSIIDNQVLDKKLIADLDKEVSAMLRFLTSTNNDKRFFKRLA